MEGNCVHGSWVRKSFGVVCRQCGEKKQEAKKEEMISKPDPILIHLRGEFNITTRCPEWDTGRRLFVNSYTKRNGYLIVHCTVRDPNKKVKGLPWLQDDILYLL